jgi:hypothetical protein
MMSEPLCIYLASGVLAWGRDINGATLAARNLATSMAMPISRP